MKRGRYREGEADRGRLRSEIRRVEEWRGEEGGSEGGIKSDKGRGKGGRDEMTSEDGALKRREWRPDLWKGGGRRKRRKET